MCSFLALRRAPHAMGRQAKRGIETIGKHEASKQKKVLTLRSNNARSARSISYVQVFGTGMDTGDTVPSVLLFFDSKRYVFNAGEGLQRFCQENRIKLSKMDHVLLTRVCSETAGGLAGALLTLAGDVGLTINIWGPSDLQYLVTALSTFLPNAAVLYAHSFGKDGKLVSSEGGDAGIAVVLEDELVKISATLLLPDQGQDCRAGDVAVVYVCELPDVTGKFDPSKAAALGLRPGPKYGQLQNGASVLSDDKQREIFPADVMEPSSPGPTVILVDCPSTAHISSLCSGNGLEKFYKQDGSNKTVSCVVHLSPAAVVRDPRYQDWMAKLAPAEHILAGMGCTELASPVLRSSAKILFKLNYICPFVFPVTGLLPQQSSANQPVPGIVAQNLLKFRLRPLSALGVDATSIPEELTGKMMEEKLLEETPEISTTSKELAALWSLYNDKLGTNNLVEEPFLNGNLVQGLNQYMNGIPDSLRGISRKDMELVFLGTGSSQPSTYRNVSAIYMHFFERGGMLLDCGEGTYGQLIRRFGAAGAKDVLRNMRCIWISHIHADHHSGLPRILSMRRSILTDVEPLLVVGPVLLKPVLLAYDKFEDLAIEFLDCSQTTSEAAEASNKKGSSSFIEGCTKMQNYWLQRGFHLRSGVDEAGRAKLNAVLEAMGLRTLLSVPVVHCPHAFAVVIEAQSNSSRPGWKLAYSGDTRPCEAFIQASQGATVFVHEATFEDGMSEEAVAKKHSSTEEAIQAGVSAQAYRIILTHFSQRYSKVPVFDESYNDSTSIAFDLMSVNLADLPILPSLVPALKLLFKNEPASEEALADDDELLEKSV